MWQDYHLPETVAEALDLLAAYNGQARVVAGGTDLILELQQGRRPPVHALVDVTRIDGLNRIQLEDGWITIGAAVTHAQIISSPLIQEHGAALVQACSGIGGLQVRNVATLAGNVAHALPAADGIVALLALGGEAEIAQLQPENPLFSEKTGFFNDSQSKIQNPKSRIRQRWVPLEAMFLGPGRSVVDSTRELITELRFRPTGEREASAFGRIMRPQGVALPILALAAMVRWDESGKQVEFCRVAMGPVAQVPFRARATEVALAGHEINEETLARAVEAALGEANPRTSAHRATQEYRREMIGVLLRRVVLGLDSLGENNGPFRDGR